MNKTNLTFKDALEYLKKGFKIKRSTWAGYWLLEDGKVMMHCKDGVCLDLRETKDTIYTISNMAKDDWEVLDVDYEHDLVETFSFGEAIRRLKQGERVARNGWNGKTQYIELAKNISYVNASGEIINIDHDTMGNKAISFVGTSGIQLGWLASQADMLSEDWIQV